MKKLFILPLLFFTFQFSNAQEVTNEQPENKNHFLINGGARFTDFDALEKNKNLYFDLEYKLKNDLSFGLRYTYSNLYYSNGGITILGSPKSHGIQFMLNNDWSEKIGLDTNKFDLYTGISAGFNFFTTESFTYPNGRIESSYSNTELLLGGQIGFRYYFTKKLGINTEINFNNYKSFIGTGLTLKL